VIRDEAPPQDTEVEETRELEHTRLTTSSTRAATSVIELQHGSVLAGRYQIEAALGQGGSGTVYRAWDRVLGEAIAVKVLRPDRAAERSWIKRLAREVKLARVIRHPNVCRIFELGHSDGHWFVTMELGAGGTLRDLLQDKAAVAQRSLAQRLSDARAICAGLAAIHAVGIIHRDVTPQNVLRLADGRLVLSDFGLAIPMTANTTIHGGTPNYMPPETLLGSRGDQRSDVWQLGVILHEVLFGARPTFHHEGDSAKMRWPLPIEASSVEEELARLCADCLASNPAARPATAMVVAGRLAAAERARPRRPLQRLWLRVRGLARRHRRLASVGGAALLLVGVVRVVQIADRPRLCRAAGDRVEGVWDAATKSRVRQAFEQTGKPYASDTFWSVDRLLQDYLGRWRGMYTDACEATHVRGEQSEEVLDLRMTCLRDRLDGVRSLSQLLVHADGAVVDNAVGAAGALGSLERCADARILRNIAPPDDAATREQVARIRAGIADAKALHDAGVERLALAKLQGLVGDARRVRYAPVEAETLLLFGEVASLTGDNEAAYAALKEALLKAEAARSDDVKAEALVYLVLAAGRRARFEEADDWASQADATLQRIGGHQQMRAWLEMHIAVNRRLQGRYDEALVHDRRALELKQQSGASRGEIARSLNNQAVILQDMGRTQEAEALFDRAVTDLGQELGAEHPLVATFISNQAESLDRLGRHEEARVAYHRAVSIEERGYGPDSTNLAYPLTGLGLSYLADHQAAMAVAPLERARVIREAHETDPLLVADTDFALARALWEANLDRARARRLAAAAEKAYGQKPTFAARSAEIERWLDARARG